MSSLGDRVRRLVGAGGGGNELDALARRVAELDERARGDAERQTAAVTGAVADLAERLAAIERRLDRLEQGSTDV